MGTLYGTFTGHSKGDCVFSNQFMHGRNKRRISSTTGVNQGRGTNMYGAFTLSGDTIVMVLSTNSGTLRCAGSAILESIDVALGGP